MKPQCYTICAVSQDNPDETFIVPPGTMHRETYLGQIDWGDLILVK